MHYWRFLAYNFALTRIEASRASIFINGVPVVTAVGAWFILGEKLTLLQMGGGALVLLAVFISSIPTKSKAYSHQEQVLNCTFRPFER
ncbi:MAG: DMT family transporter [Syntrophomonadaceae bacterium]|nr:DMT family transporter [Syntrophomonadaceae bacterium]